MDDDTIVVNKGVILALINSVRQFCDITEIKGFESMNLIMGVEIGLEGFLKSAATTNKPKPKEAVNRTPKEEAEENTLINFTARQAEGKV